MVVDFRLEVFIAVARHLSFSKAAKSVYISQPAISRHIQELESAYNTRLFDRLGKGIALTEAGRLLLDYAERIVSSYNELHYEMHLLHNQKSGRLRIGASSTIAQYLLPPILARFSARYPLIHLSLVSGNSKKITHALKENLIDIGLVEGLLRYPNLKYQHFCTDELVFVANPQHPIFRLKEVSFLALMTYPFVIREQGSGTLECFEEQLKKSAFKLSDIDIRCTIDSTQGIAGYVSESNCIGVLPQILFEKTGFEKLKIVDVVDFRLSRDVVFVGHQGADNQLVTDFIRFALEGVGVG